MSEYVWGELRGMPGGPHYYIYADENAARIHSESNEALHRLDTITGERLRARVKYTVLYREGEPSVYGAAFFEWAKWRGAWV